jgi:hypothetical protein
MTTVLKQAVVVLLVVVLAVPCLVLAVMFGPLVWLLGGHWRGLGFEPRDVRVVR